MATWLPTPAGAAGAGAGELRDVPCLVAEAARRGPELAVRSEALDTEDGAKYPADRYCLTFPQLLQKAQVLACELRRRSPEPLVAVCLQRTPALVVALLGVWCAGKAYLPLEPTHPGARLRFLLEDSGAEVLVTCWCVRRRNLLPEERIVRVAAVDGRLICPEGAQPPLSAPDLAVEPTDLQTPAYLMYTSGSTGTPKGVLVARRGVLNVLHAFNDMIRPGRDTGDAGDGAGGQLLATTTYCFDISVLEIFWPLCFGFSLFLVSASTARNGGKLARLVESQGADLLQGTPAMWRSLVANGWTGHAGLAAICGGEAFPLSLVEPLLSSSGAGLWNAYGPTEATIWATSFRLAPGFAPKGSVPIGWALPNVRLAISHAGEEEADGELLVGGIGVALGYHNRPELTAQSFLDSDEGKVYRTGDLVRHAGDGLEFLGRLDQQVKFRGFRIELGEIEAAARTSAQWLYFSAHWCPPCRGFTPALKQFYETLKEKGENVEIIFVSADKTPEEAQDYFANHHGDWLAVDFKATKEREQLSRHFEVSGIPSLILVDSHGKAVEAVDGRSDVASCKTPEAVMQTFAGWKKSAGDWRETAGTALGGSGAPAAAGDAAALRAARLAALEKAGR
ncbi:unnamed protein product [Effrenium voratum]|nr:unnamed protein product [Effrenium voratum]